ncbi:MAG: hypothetical protein ATN36_04130 [Epulopiscium sp. Nele67-Bin005]|nr:MAG: hypothetical protein ATN36_04130 [Epulopiscium sp. Nele67-Bin005]
MIRVSECLAKDFAHVRVDLYRLNDGQIKFGEMTFFLCYGVAKWSPPEADLKMGELFDLSELMAKVKKS